MSEIKELYAWIVDDPTGEHGIIGLRLSDGMRAQAVTSKRHIAEILRPTAEDAARKIGLPVLLQHFTLVETLDKV